MSNSRLSVIHFAKAGFGLFVWLMTQIAVASGAGGSEDLGLVELPKIDAQSEALEDVLSAYEKEIASSMINIRSLSLIAKEYERTGKEMTPSEQKVFENSLAYYLGQLNKGYSKYSGEILTYAADLEDKLFELDMELEQQLPNPTASIATSIRGKELAKVSEERIKALQAIVAQCGEKQESHDTECKRKYSNAKRQLTLINREISRHISHRTGAEQVAAATNDLRASVSTANIVSLLSDAMADMAAHIEVSFNGFGKQSTLNTVSSYVTYINALDRSVDRSMLLVDGLADLPGLLSGKVSRVNDAMKNVPEVTTEDVLKEASELSAMLKKLED